MNLAATIRNKQTYKECKFLGCTNTFVGTQLQNYCRDPRCIEFRKKQYLARKKKKNLHNREINRRVVKSKLSSKFESGKILRLKCKAVDKDGNRCNEMFTVIYDRRVGVYPKFCSCHRNEYKRILFAKRSTRNATNRSY